VKKLLLGLFFIASSCNQTFGMSYVKKLIHMQHEATMGFLETSKDNNVAIKFKEISKEQYPKAIVYLETMKAKYPKALDGVSIVIANVTVSMSSSLVIMFPKLWIDQLEAEIVLGQTTQVQNVIEWFLLHEAGHVNKEHISKLVIATTATTLLVAYTVWKSEYLKDYSTVQRFFIKYGIYAIAANILSYAERTAYSRYVMEPEADDFANELCSNPKAFDAAAEWLERVAVDNASYPTKASRIGKIQQTLLKKFGTPEVVTAQA